MRNSRKRGGQDPSVVSTERIQTIQAFYKPLINTSNRRNTPTNEDPIKFINTNHSKSNIKILNESNNPQLPDSDSIPYFPDAVPMTEEEVAALGPFGPEYTVYDGITDGVYNHDIEISRALYQYYDAPTGKDLSEFKKELSENKEVVEALRSTGEFTNDGRTSITKVSGGFRQRGGLTAEEIQTKISEYEVKLENGGVRCPIIELIKVHTTIVPDTPAPTILKKIIDYICFQDADSKITVSYRGHRTSECMRKTDGNFTFKKAQLKSRSYEAIRNVDIQKFEYNSSKSLMDAFGKNYTKLRIFLYALVMKCVFNTPKGLSVADEKSLYDLMFEYFEFPMDKREALTKRIKKNKITHDDYPYADVECIPYKKPDGTFGNSVRSIFDDAIVPHIFGILVKERPSVVVIRNTEKIYRNAFTEKPGLSDKIAIRHDNVDYNTPKYEKGKDEGKKIGSDEITEKYIYMLKAPHPYIIENDHLKFAAMAQAAYLPSDTLGTVFRAAGPPNERIHYLGSFRGDPEWVKLGIDPQSNEDYVKHRVHVWFTIKNKPLINTRTGEVDGKGNIELYITFRGSHTSKDWNEIDMDITYGTAAFFNDRVQDFPLLIDDIMRKLSEHELLKLDTAISSQSKINYDLNIYSTGHSLGGFLALMLSYHSLGNITKDIVRFPERITSATPFQIIVNDKNKFITPIAFNPFCSSSAVTSDCLKIIPNGFVYRVRASADDSSTHILHDVASQVFTQKVINESALNVYETVIAYGTGGLCTTQTMTACHIMYQFLGSIWCHLQLASSRISPFVKSGNILIRESFEEPGIGCSHKKDKFNLLNELITDYPIIQDIITIPVVGGFRKTRRNRHKGVRKTRRFRIRKSALRKTIKNRRRK